MNEEIYPFTLTRHELRYEFVSISEKKKVRKVVLLTQTEENIIYNLALLDVLEDGSFCDITETRNRDLSTVMATVVHIVNNFLCQYPDTFTMFRGSDARRNRLYRIIIAREFEELSRDFKIFGVKNGTPQLFIPNKDFDYYLVGKYENSEKNH